MSGQVAQFELHKKQLADSLAVVADSMRNCAQMADTFARIVAETSYSPETAELIHAALDDGKGKRKAALSPEDGDTKKRKRNTKPKDPNAPKRPASSYILFQNEVRKELKERHPDMSNSDLLGMISEQWKNMSDDQKETYNQAMKTAKAQYSEEKKAYDNRTPAEIEAANAATEAAKLLKKANAKPRGPRPAASVAAPAAVKARPPPNPDEISPSSATSDDEESEDEEPQPQQKHVVHNDTESSDEEEEPEPAPKKRRGTSVQPTVQKSKKTSRV